MQAQTPAPGRKRSPWAEQLLREAERKRAIPGIHFVDSSSGHVPCLKGTGIKVYIIIRDLRDLEWDELALVKSYPWLTWEQLGGAIQYYEAYPEEIDEALAEADSWTVERILALNERVRAIRAERDA